MLIISVVWSEENEEVEAGEKVEAEKEEKEEEVGRRRVTSALQQNQLVAMMSVPSATVFARRGLSYLMSGQPELALRDAMQAQVCMPEWPTAFYLQALALSKLGMETDAQDMLNDGAAFEAKRQSGWHG
ncbi:hypothetical protein BHE74_00011079 [Ensete ventricosum]|uniref:Serine/threonine-protein kinase BSK1-like TPR repeats domain-containing protein n=1 Tax=Ensete ventricosum TaxID=4639 RepID=A0A444E8Y2_ENSVE|nr:hypothetical protein GW17_00029806 [Ensete ventricosum]RWW80568.1 hypothetical protein BHE74_00011079 [Ensete ventricosum]RZR73503.1 hypothetical protein BHM03_00025040 [Ensete ventricosum]